MISFSRVIGMIVVLSWHLSSPAFLSADPKPKLSEGKGKFQFQGNLSRLEVFYYKPAHASKETPVWFVLHGTNRNADDYRDNWVELAKKYEVLIVAPRFDKENYPAYNLGGVMSSRGEPLPRNKTMFHTIEMLFDDVVQREGLVATSYSLFGHSAGAQFGQRMVMFYPGARIRMAVIANPGWYSLPLATKDFPYGVGKTNLTGDDLQKVFQVPMYILLGEDDTDPNHKYLNDSPEANEQGPHRLARGENFYRVCTEQARALKWNCEWKIQIIPGVAHSNEDMAAHGAQFLAGKARISQSKKRSERSLALPAACFSTKCTAGRVQAENGVIYVPARFNLQPFNRSLHTRAKVTRYTAFNWKALLPEECLDALHFPSGLSTASNCDCGKSASLTSFAHSPQRTRLS